jgi:hypothetical protein
VNSIGSRAMKNVRLSTQEDFSDRAPLLGSSSLASVVACALVVVVLFFGISRRSWLLNRIPRMYGTVRQ